MVADHTKQNRVTSHFKGHAVVQVDAGFLDPFGSLDSFGVQGGMPEILRQQPKLFIDLSLDG